ncbi:MAG: type II secretion system protein [Pontibacterium sp.]
MNNLTQQSGFSYMEVLAASFLIAVAIVPALQALQSGAQRSAVNQAYIIDHYHLQAKLEAVLAEPFSNLEAASLAAGSKSIASLYSDSITTTDGRTLSLDVFLSACDGDNLDNDNNVFTGTDTGLLWVQVSIAGTTQHLQTLIYQ